MCNKFGKNRFKRLHLVSIQTNRIIKQVCKSVFCYLFYAKTLKPNETEHMSFKKYSFRDMHKIYFLLKQQTETNLHTIYGKIILNEN